jgi:hypothetical protein
MFSGSIRVRFLFFVVVKPCLIQSAVIFAVCIQIMEPLLWELLNCIFIDFPCRENSLTGAL